ncbi:MAG: N-glycosylase/DNA lyase [Elusimicrobia bacterium]|nr:N-glycosylase/DNA lyase [Elusimicrobiota bacterium]
MNSDPILKIYKEKREEIEERLDSFRKKGAGSDSEVFAELCFCLMTPQSRAIAADAALKRIVKRGLLFSTDIEKIKESLTGVRFHNKKSIYIVEAGRRFAPSRGVSIKEYLSEKDDRKMRGTLAADIKGLGYKEASHFMRNIGRGTELAILDRHILKGLKTRNVIEDFPLNITPSVYLEIEQKMKNYAHDIGVPIEALDLIFWYMQTGFFFR